ncbi:MAG: alanine racemase [Deltaproteobacteria bacterium RIFCSPLOWO2_02_FULL_46_8]|nr:MAG: alanine racemase [Deltaproteobacteria bacterium RIFCSPLOWO2_02_FULL_46_8]
MQFFRPTHAVIDLAALKHNYHEVVKKIPKQICILPMVKADAYGHGAIPIAKTLASCGAVCLGVATVEEGIELREAGIKTKILVMGGLLGSGEEAAKAMLQYCLTPVVHSAGVVDLLDALAKKQGVQIVIHLKLDTGMSRMGITPPSLPNLLEKLKNATSLQLEGVMTHLAWRQNAEYTEYQTHLFEGMVDQVKEVLGPFPILHIANSASVLSGEPIHFSKSFQYWVRPGIMLYGIPPYPDFAGRANLKPVLSLKSKIALIKHVPSGTKISYNCTFTTTRSSCIGLISVGYADGYPWSASNKGEVLVEGKRAKVLGRVTMDMILVDLTDLPEAKVGSDVVLLGGNAETQISADELAEWAGTIPYEIVCRLSKRIPRIYFDSANPKS